VNARHPSIIAGRGRSCSRRVASRWDGVPRRAMCLVAPGLG